MPLHFGAFDDAQVSHFLSIPAKFDLYSVTLQQGELLDASVTPRAIRQCDRERAARVRFQWRILWLDDQQGGDPQLSFQATAAGVYYMGVSSAPNDNYNPTGIRQRCPGGTTGLYTLDVTLKNGVPVVPDLTGSSFRTGLDGRCWRRDSGQFHG